MLHDDVVEGQEQPFGREEVHDDAVRQFDRFGLRRAGLGIEAEIEDQFFGGDAHAAEIGVNSGQGAVDRLGSAVVAVRPPGAFPFWTDRSSWSPLVDSCPA